MQYHVGHRPSSVLGAMRTLHVRRNIWPTAPPTSRLIPWAYSTAYLDLSATSVCLSAAIQVFQVRNSAERLTRSDGGACCSIAHVRSPERIQRVSSIEDVAGKVCDMQKEDRRTVRCWRLQQRMSSCERVRCSVEKMQR